MVLYEQPAAALIAPCQQHVLGMHQHHLARTEAHHLFAPQASVAGRSGRPWAGRGSAAPAALPHPNRKLPDYCVAAQGPAMMEWWVWLVLMLTGATLSLIHI